MKAGEGMVGRIARTVHWVYEKFPRQRRAAIEEREVCVFRAEVEQRLIENNIVQRSNARILLVIIC